MKHRSLLFAWMILLALFPACRKSEIGDAPAAEVSETAPTATTAGDTATQPAGNVTTADVIKDKSSIEFIGAKVTRDHHGKFHNFGGRIEYAGGKPQRVHFEIDLNSIETDEPKLTAHLKTPDFFDVQRFPKATFTSTALTEGAPAGAPAGTTHTLRGTLDMHGVQKEVTVPVVAQVTPDGVRTTSDFRINRHDWGISYRGMADDLIKDEVRIKLNLLFPPPPAA